MKSLILIATIFFCTPCFAQTADQTQPVKHGIRHKLAKVFCAPFRCAGYLDGLAESAWDDAYFKARASVVKTSASLTK